MSQRNTCRFAPIVSVFLMIAAMGCSPDADVRDPGLQEVVEASPWSPLHQAAERGDAATIRSLVTQGTNPDSNDNDLGYTPLHLAALGNQVESVQTLIELGASTDAVGSSNVTALFHAARKDHYAVAEALLIHAHNRAALVNQATNYGTTSLMAAAATGNPDLVVLLLKAGAETSPKDSRGKSASDYATDKDHAAVRTLIDTWQPPT